ncbi:MAG: hypothetical protein AB7E32_15535 [Desulfovibrio sp.]
MSIAITDNGQSWAALLPALRGEVGKTSGIDPLASASVAAESDQGAPVASQNRNVAAEAAALESQSALALQLNATSGQRSQQMTGNPFASEALPPAGNSGNTLIRRAVESYGTEDFPQAGSRFDKTA